MALRSNQAYRITYPYTKEVPEKPPFPSTRYFQVHFEHLEQQLDDNRHDLENLRWQVTEFTGQLAMLTTLLNDSKEKK
jgi:hypothetical protein